ncbi:hypothetical protein LZ30DRAFT_722981 [Colletotrichum cereale]|nr:hypothetical protein LZ30DRAFT_722981 [Colletotrichum cereale]
MQLSTILLTLFVGVALATPSNVNAIRENKEGCDDCKRDCRQGGSQVALCISNCEAGPCKL